MYTVKLFSVRIAFSNPLEVVCYKTESLNNPMTSYTLEQFEKNSLKKNRLIFDKIKIKYNSCKIFCRWNNFQQQNTQLIRIFLIPASYL